MPYKVTELSFNKNRLLAGLLSYVRENFSYPVVTYDTVIAYLVETFPSVQRALAKNGKNWVAFLGHEKDIAAMDAKNYRERLEDEGLLSQSSLPAATDERPSDDRIARKNFDSVINPEFTPLMVGENINRIFQVIESNHKQATPSAVFWNIVSLAENPLLNQSVYNMERAAKPKHNAAKTTGKTKRQPPEPADNHVENTKRKPPRHRGH